MRLLFDNFTFRYEPYPIGLITPMFDEASYAQMIEEFPPLEKLKRFGNVQEGYNKFALNEFTQGYHDFLQEHLVWSAFYMSVKRVEFPQFVMKFLADHQVPVTPSPRWTTRFEFAMMPADGGLIAPHTDIASKAVTLIFSMQKPGEWDPAWGGGTDILKPLGTPGVVYQSYRAPLAAFEKLGTYEYLPNQCVVFVKNDISWHSVGPMTGPEGPMRKTLTLNIERAT